MTRQCYSLAWLVIAGTLWTTLPLRAQEAAPSSPTTTIQSKSEEVLLDVVVRDKKGRTVTDLKPEDFQILDNGEPKKINAFRLVQEGEAISSGGSRTQLDPLQQVRLITMIFQCSSTDARRLARDAATGLLKGELPQNVYVAIMTIDHKIEVLQQFTNDPALLRKAIDRATGSESTDFSSDTERVQKDLEQMLGPSSGQSPEQQIASAQAAQSSPPAPGQTMNGASIATVAMAKMVLEMLRSEQSNSMREDGRVSIYALLDAVKEQYRLPGRKTVLYFRQGGFSIPQGMEQPFRNVISIANRANVSFYAVDARGLTIAAMNSGANSQLKSAVSATTRQAGNMGDEAVTPEQAKAFDTAIEATRGNTQNTLANLAESTGGALVANTNDLRGPLQRLVQDIQTYYEVTYSPEIKAYDGSFHKITVKLASSDLRVQSRSGYFALPPGMHGGAANLQPFEVPLLTAINAPQVPHDFVFHSALMHFRDAKQQPLSVLAMDVPFANVTFIPKEKDHFEGHLSYLALVKGDDGKVMNKIQNEIPINVTADKLPALKNSHFIYTGHFELPPGHYTVDFAVLDSENQNKISAQKVSLTVLAPASTLAMSSVSFVRRMNDKSTGGTEDFDPLQIGDKVVSPDLDPTVRPGTGANLSFYLVAYADAKIPTPPTLTMEFSQNGQFLGKASTDIGKPNSQGLIQYVGSIPASALNPGDYSVRFVLQQGTEAADETAFFRVQ
jgi:VWFA-related protein